MVLAKTNKCSSIKSNIRFVILALLFLTGIGCVATILFNGPSTFDAKDKSTVNNGELLMTPNTNEAAVEKIYFQPLIDRWVESTYGSKGIIIYDLEREEIVGSYNADASFPTASLYKLFVVYEGYKKINSGEWSANSIVGSTGKTIIECLDLSIRESNSECAENILNMIGRKQLERVIEEEYNLVSTNVDDLVSTPNDIMKIMKLFYRHPDFNNDELIERMKDSLLNQPVTTYDWRQGLPSGFSRAKVYNKVGWDYNPDGGYWNIYNDAAIVEFPDKNRHFIVVVMTNSISNTKIAKLGADIEAVFYQ